MFFDFTIKDAIDIVLFALLLYYMYKMMKDSGSLNIFAGIMMFLFVWVLVSKISPYQRCPEGSGRHGQNPSAYGPT